MKPGILKRIQPTEGSNVGIGQSFERFCDCAVLLENDGVEKEIKNPSYAEEPFVQDSGTIPLHGPRLLVVRDCVDYSIANSAESPSQRP